MVKPKYVLEVGTYTGYSAICLAKGLQENGQLHTIEINKELENFTSQYFKKAKLDNKINLICGNAKDTLSKLKNENTKFDLIFIDADKENYINYYELALNLISKNGLIIIDNVLWKGEVSDLNKNDKLTNIIRDFNSHIKNDLRIEKTILPIGDGITICRKL